MAADLTIRAKLHKAGRLACFPGEAPFRSSEFEGSRVHCADSEQSGNDETEALQEGSLLAILTLNIEEAVSAGRREQRSRGSSSHPNPGLGYLKLEAR